MLCKVDNKEYEARQYNLRKRGYPRRAWNRGCFPGRLGGSIDSWHMHGGGKGCGSHRELGTNVLITHKLIVRVSTSYSREAGVEAAEGHSSDTSGPASPHSDTGSILTFTFLGLATHPTAHTVF